MPRWIALLSLLLAMTAGANDGYAWIEGAGGRARLVDGEHASVRMVRETVRMDIDPTHYTVDARFTFTNTGKATTVTMGFPETGAGGGDGGGIAPARRTRTAFVRFRTRVDGTAVTATRRLVSADAGHHDSAYAALWTKTVRFAAGQTREVRVSYRAEPGARGTTTSGDHRFARYLFSGGNWQGRVAESRLTVRMRIPGWTTYQSRVPAHQSLTARTRRGNVLTFVWRNWQADGAFTLNYCTTDPGWLGCPNGRWGGGMGVPFAPDGDFLVRRRPAPVDWTPPAILRGPLAFGSLRQLYSHAIPGAAWDARRQTLTWSARGHRLRIRVGDRIMLVDGRPHRLPAAPFLSRPNRRGERQCFMPLRALLPYLPFTEVRVEAGKHLVLLSEP